MFVTINKNGIKINVGVSVKNYLKKKECDKRFIWNPSNYNCECNKSCNVGGVFRLKIVNVEKKQPIH